MSGPRAFNYITEEVIKSGCIEIRSTQEDIAKLSEVNLYNRYMKECRGKMQELKRVRNLYLITNVFAIVFLMSVIFVGEMILPQEKPFYVKLFISVGLVVIYAVVYVVFSFWKDELELLPNVLLTATLLYIDSAFICLLIVNIGLCVFYRCKKGNLGEEPAYPVFYDLRVDRVRGKVYDTGKRRNGPDGLVFHQK